MSLTLIRLLVDFGLVILIWMIQLMVYPSFLYFKNEELLKWHNIYTFRIACLVIPLMFGQLFIYLYQVFEFQSTYHVFTAGIVILLWIITFWIFVPLHNDILNNRYTRKTLEQLVHKNWERTGLWSVLFILSLIEYLHTTN
ncbi:MAG: hypothetical protein KDD05_08735 [Psychroserpens sp.]|nr:hypothetical protein [Psychroserpens sp.]